MFDGRCFRGTGIYNKGRLLLNYRSSVSTRGTFVGSNTIQDVLRVDQRRASISEVKDQQPGGARDEFDERFPTRLIPSSDVTGLGINLVDP